ncbi:MAG TPA: ATP phosphoribosyltransferase regulatory subunit, partial [Candidatus Baltobacteraceae bacterium]|nr:ATP phosphoribosyltransferase regulatory subunit [Candidatus Baltobacteraceae bacterium]
VNQQSIDALSNDLRRGEELAQLRTKLQSTEAGREGLAEVDELLSLVAPMLKSGSIKFDAFLARGLSYYTGNIFEIVTENSGLTIASGGRYDDLIGMFTKSSIPACGGSLGIDRIMALMLQDADPHLDFPKVLVTVWDSSAAPDALRFAAMLRESDISTEVYVGNGNIGRQLKYAAGRNIPVCIIQGPDEKMRDRILVKDMKCKIQIELSPNDVVAHIQKLGDVDTLASHALQAGFSAGSARNVPGETVEKAQRGNNLRLP